MLPVLWADFQSLHGVRMTPNQIELGRHALGLPNRGRRSYRNHFVAGPKHDDYAEWMKMVEQGDAMRGAGSELSGGDFVFRMTNVGALACLNVGEKLDREDFEATGHGPRIAGHRK
jgi:hypothetical protein